MKITLIKSAVAVFTVIVVTVLLIFVNDSSEISETNNSRYVIEESKEYIKWSNIIETKGPEEGYEIFKEFFKELYLVQHNMSHIFGDILYEKEGVSGVAICDSTFSFGCFHGFFTSAISDVGLEIIPFLDEACNESTECQHGIGHGLMEYMGNNIVSALRACELTNQPDPLAGCTSGVFMEYNVPLVVHNDTISVEPRELNEEKPYGPCIDIPERFRNSCYHELGQWWNQVYEKDYKLIGNLCKNIENDTYRQSCFSGVGNIIPNSAEYNLELTIQLCEEMPTDEGIVNCKIRASWAFLNSPNQSIDGPLVCGALEEEDKKQCLKNEDIE